MPAAVMTPQAIEPAGPDSAGPAITTPTLPPVVIECERLRRENARLREENESLRSYVDRLTGPSKWLLQEKGESG